MRLNPRSKVWNWAGEMILEGYGAREVVRCTRPLRGSPGGSGVLVYGWAAPPSERCSGVSHSELPTAGSAGRELRRHRDVTERTALPRWQRHRGQSGGGGKHLQDDPTTPNLSHEQGPRISFIFDGFHSWFGHLGAAETRSAHCRFVHVKECQ